MPRFRGLEIERRIDAQRFPELVTALVASVGRALDESQVFVGCKLVGLVEARRQGGPQRFCSLRIFAVVVGGDARGE